MGRSRQSRRLAPWAAGALEGAAVPPQMPKDGALSEKQQSELGQNQGQRYRRRSPRRKGRSRPSQGNRAIRPISWRRPPVCGHPVAVALSFQNHAAQAQQRNGAAVQPKSHRHRQHAGQHGKGHAGRTGQADRRALMQGCPPLHRENIDRDIDDSRQRQPRPGLVAKGGSSIAACSAINPKKRNNRISSENSRASHTHHVPQIGLAQREPVHRARNANIAPVEASARAIIAGRRALNTSPTPAQTASSR